MSLILNINKLCEILQPKAVDFLDQKGDSLLSRISTDTRHLSQGEAFLALRGETFDGHTFVESALEKGASVLIVDHPISVISPKQIPQIIVSDTLVAYQKIAHWWRNQFKIPLIGITGSVGKTTTKELIAGCLGIYGKVHKTEANYNNEIGVPKTLLALTGDHDYAILEMAMRGRGEIALLSQIARPDIGIITNVGTAHIGRLGSREAIAEAKCELLAEMPPTSVAILNHDNPLLLKTAAQVWSGERITYGLEGGDLRGKIVEKDILEVEGVRFPLPLPGRHNALNYLAALAVTKVLGLDWTDLTKGIKVDLPKGRSQRYVLPSDVVTLDETYNAGLESMVAALQLLKDTTGSRHIAVLGAMKELGEKSPELHQQVGKTAKALGIDRLLVLVDDPQAEAIAVGATGIETICLKTKEELGQTLMEMVISGDRLLFKASNSVGLQQVVEQFKQQWSAKLNDITKNK